MTARDALRDEVTRERSRVADVPGGFVRAVGPDQRHRAEREAAADEVVELREPGGYQCLAVQARSRPRGGRARRGGDGRRGFARAADSSSS